MFNASTNRVHCFNTTIFCEDGHAVPTLLATYYMFDINFNAKNLKTMGLMAVLLGLEPNPTNSQKNFVNKHYPTIFKARVR